MNVFIMDDSIVKPFGRGAQNNLIGYAGEHGSRTFVIRTMDDISDYTVISLIIDTVDCGAMTRTSMPDGSTMLSLVLTSDIMKTSGNRMCQLMMTDGEKIMKSSQFCAYVSRSNNIEDALPDGATLTIINETITQIIDDAVNDITDASTQAVTDINTAGSAVIESIPQDYTALSTQVAENVSSISQLNESLSDLSQQEVINKTRLCIPAKTLVDFPGDGYYIQNPFHIGQTGSVYIYLYDDDGNGITITKVSDGSVVSSDGIWRYSYNPAGSKRVVWIKDMKLHVVSFTNWRVDSSVLTTLEPSSYDYILSSVPKKIKFSHRMTYNCVSKSNAPEFDEKIDNASVLGHITNYVDERLSINKLFKRKTAVLRLNIDGSDVSPALYNRYPLLEGHYFNLPMSADTATKTVVFYDADGNVIYPTGGLVKQANFKRCTIQQRYSFEYAEGKVKMYEWYAHGSIPDYPLPAYTVVMGTYGFENDAVPAYISMEGSYNCVYTDESEASDDDQFVDIVLNGNYGFGDQLADIAEESIKNGFGDVSDFGRWLKSQFVYQTNRMRHALRISTFNVARYGHKHWYRIKQFYQEHGVDIAGLQEVSYPLGNTASGFNFVFSDYFESWQFKHFSANGEAYPQNERMFMSTLDYPIVSTNEVYYQTQKIDSSGDHRYYTKCEFTLPRYMDKRGSEYLKMSIYNTQLEVSSPNTRLAQAQELCAVAVADQNPFIIVLGDTNDFGLDKPIWEIFENAGFSAAISTNTATVSGKADFNCIDNLFLSRRLSAIDYDVINAYEYMFESSSGANPLSDHDMVFADIALDYSDIRCVNIKVRYGTPEVTAKGTVLERDADGYTLAYDWLTPSETMSIRIVPDNGYNLGTIKVFDCQIANPNALSVSGDTINIDGSALIGDVYIVCTCTASS